MKKSNGGAGFSLLEVCLSLGIIALVFSLSVYSFSAYLDFNCLHFWRQQILADLRTAKMAALASGNYATVQFKAQAASTAATYTAFKVNPSEKKQSLYSKTLPPSLNFVASKEIRFATSSFCVPGYSGTIYLKSRRAKTQSIVVSAIGRIR